jgi:bifunctional DNase/RNase
VLVTELRESTYYALIEVSGNQLVQIDARPSDAIALAVRASAPIFVSNEVLDAGVSGSDDTRALDIDLELPSVDSCDRLGA